MQIRLKAKLFKITFYLECYKSTRISVVTVATGIPQWSSIDCRYSRHKGKEKKARGKELGSYS